MRIKIMDEIKNKHSIDSKKKASKSFNAIPDHQNIEACLDCPLKDCKSRCGRLKRGGSR